MPTGMTIDTAKSTGLTFGVAGASNSGGTGSYTGQVRSDTSTSVIFYGDSNAAVWNATVPRTFAQNDRIDFTFPVAIVGWSSSVIMSNDASTNVVAMAANTSTTTISGSVTTLLFTSIDFDTAGGYAAGTGLYTVQTPGIYKVEGMIYLDLVDGLDKLIQVYVYKNSSNVCEAVYRTQSASAFAAMNFPVSGLVSCVAGDTLSIRASTDGTTPTISTTRCRFQLQRLSGPAQIAASESVTVAYTDGAGTSIVNDNTAVYATKVKDTHGAFASGIFTAPFSGNYYYSFQTRSNSRTWLTSENLGLIVFHNNVTAINSPVTVGNGAASTPSVTASGTYPLLAGETLRAKYSTGHSGAATSGVANQVNIYRIGNY